VSDEYGRARNPDDLTEEAYARAADSAGPEHTDVHRIGSRLVELLQDVAVLLLNVTLLGLGFVLLYKVWRESFALVEVGVSAIIQKMILVGVDKYTMQQLVGISLILVSLSVILWVDLHGSRPT
jgi:uncharacterized membrane protein (DUF373 family)